MCPAILCLLNVFVSGCSITDSIGPGYTDYQSVIDGYASQYDIPGVLALVAQRDSVWTGASGVSNFDTGRAMRPTDKFRVASITKTFTATTILQLVEEARLELDDSIEFYLGPDIVDSISIIDGQTYGYLITIRLLLNHRSGIYDFVDDNFYDLLYADPHRRWEPMDLVHYAIRNGNALFIPDLIPANDYHYSNTNYVLLGLIIEECTGKPFHQVLRERIYQRLGLDSTSLAEYEADPPGLVQGYDGDRNVSSFDYGFEWANAGIISTTEDVYTFLKELMSDQLFAGPNTLEEMKNANGYGLGLQAISTTSGLLAYGHFGESLGFVSVMMYVPSEETYIIAAMNQRMTNQTDLYLDLLSLVR